jgi:hypothetical protein
LTKTAESRCNILQAKIERSIAAERSHHARRHPEEMIESQAGLSEDWRLVRSERGKIQVAPEAEIKADTAGPQLHVSAQRRTYADMAEIEAIEAQDLRRVVEGQLQPEAHVQAVRGHVNVEPQISRIGTRRRAATSITPTPTATAAAPTPTPTATTAPTSPGPVTQRFGQLQFVRMIRVVDPQRTMWRTPEDARFVTVFLNICGGSG